ncbi:hypothetical protein AB0H71_13785 [Nocardia sp. NPDC050697]|uniref:hypothetical protein n=1 Tax=Nocardia sp. NPDC050697 TaxID=3155158 RepID=UPI0033DC758C
MIRSGLAAALRSLANRLAPAPPVRVFVGEQDGDDALYPSTILTFGSLDPASQTAWLEHLRSADPSPVEVVLGNGRRGAGGGGGGGASFGGHGPGDPIGTHA